MCQPELFRLHGDSQEVLTVRMFSVLKGHLASPFGLFRNPGHYRVPVLAGIVARRWNQILPSLLNTYEQLKKLGLTYNNGFVSVIVPNNPIKKKEAINDK